MPFSNSVSVIAEAMQFTMTLLSLSSFANPLAKPITPAFVTE